MTDILWTRDQLRAYATPTFTEIPETLSLIPSNGKGSIVPTMLMLEIYAIFFGILMCSIKSQENNTGVTADLDPPPPPPLSQLTPTLTLT